MKTKIIVLGITTLLIAGFSYPKAQEALANGDAFSEKTAAVASNEKTEMVIPQVVDDSHATKQVVTTLNSYFNTKSSKDVDGTMSFFDKAVKYDDATLGWAFNYDQLKTVFKQYMPNWGNGLSYPTRIVGDKHSAMVLFTDTPELFGQEIRLMGSVTFNDEGKITRWIDYWDGRSWTQDYLKTLKTPADKYPKDLGEDIEQNASQAIIDVSNKLNAALANNDSKGAAELFSSDAVYEDMALRSEIQGQAAIERFFKRTSDELPYGSGSNVRYVVGGDQGGGYEWGNAVHSVPRGSIALELNSEGKITRMTAVWDSSLMSDEAIHSLIKQSIDNM